MVEQSRKLSQNSVLKLPVGYNPDVSTPPDKCLQHVVSTVSESAPSDSSHLTCTCRVPRTSARCQVRAAAEPAAVEPMAPRPSGGVLAQYGSVQEGVDGAPPVPYSTAAVEGLRRGVIRAHRPSAAQHASSGVIGQRAGVITTAIAMPCDVRTDGRC